MCSNKITKPLINTRGEINCEDKTVEVELKETIFDKIVGKEQEEMEDEMDILSS